MSGTVVEYIVCQLLLSSFSLQCERICMLLNGKVFVLFLPFQTAFLHKAMSKPI